MVIKRIVVLFIVIFLNQGCARNVTQSTGQGIGNYSEDISGVRPVFLSDKKTDAQKQKEEEKTEEPAFGASSPVNENERIGTALSRIASYNAGIKEAPGFRIQLFSGNNKTEFETAKSFVIQNFPELELYESYSQPTYRLKIGDFLNRMDAERYYNTVVQRFISARIINETIDVQKGFRIN